MCCRQQSRRGGLSCHVAPICAALGRDAQTASSHNAPASTLSPPECRCAACSWLQKLDLAKQLLVDEAPEKRPGLDRLAPLYIYLQWIATGSITCVEGGGHYRPNKHAELARTIFRSLEWVIGGGSDPMQRLVARHMQAHASQSCCCMPLLVAAACMRGQAMRVPCSRVMRQARAMHAAIAQLQRAHTCNRCVHSLPVAAS